MNLVPDWAPNIHPLLVHFPIALLCAAAAVDVVGWAFRRNRQLRQLATLLYVLGTGGAIVAWQDLRMPVSVVAVQHVRADGELDPAWPHLGRAVLGVPLVNPDAGEFLPAIVSDGAADCASADWRARVDTHEVKSWIEGTIRDRFGHWGDD